VVLLHALRTGIGAFEASIQAIDLIAEPEGFLEVVVIPGGRFSEDVVEPVEQFEAGRESLVGKTGDGAAEGGGRGGERGTEPLV
jgi:hypothetical protein